MHLEKSSGGYEYVLMIVDHVMHGHTQQKTNREKVLLDCCLMITYSGMAIQIRFIKMKGVSLSARCSTPLKKLPTLDTQEPFFITRNVMGSLKDSIAPYFQC